MMTSGYCGLHINLQPPHPALELETGIYIVFDYGTSILGQKYRDFEECSAVDNVEIGWHSKL